MYGHGTFRSWSVRCLDDVRKDELQAQLRGGRNLGSKMLCSLYPCYVRVSAGKKISQKLTPLLLKEQADSSIPESLGIRALLWLFTSLVRCGYFSCGAAWSP